MDSNYISGIDKLDEYGEATASALLYLVLQMAGIASVHVDHAASHLGMKCFFLIMSMQKVNESSISGKAYATVLRLRAIPHLARLRKIEIPSQLIDKVIGLGIPTWSILCVLTFPPAQYRFEFSRQRRRWTGTLRCRLRDGLSRTSTSR